ncbi:MAG: DUF4091 domain-containing protein [Armatimonadetes bacterium]|nr:DUF4091 domain-containing protein [Armatimonadota bacterium]
MTALLAFVATASVLWGAPAAKMVEDFESLDAWRTRDKEISISLDQAHARTGKSCLHLRMAVDLKNGDTKYPMGWPAATKTYAEPIDLAGWQFLEFDLYFNSSLHRDPDFAMHVTLRDEKGRTFYRTTLTDLRQGKWAHERLCIAGMPNLRLGELHLWFSEETYDHGEIVDIYVDSLRATRAPARPKLPDFSAGPTRGVLASGPRAKLWLAEPVEKVLRKAAPPTARLKRLRLAGARNEYVSAQVVLQPAAEATGAVRVSMSDLRGPGGATLAASNLWWSAVDYVPAREGPKEGLPDPLPGPKPFVADQPWNYPLWLDLYVPPEAHPGEYKGSLTVTFGDERLTVPVALRVFGFSVPKTQSVGFVTHIYGPWGWSKDIQKWFGNMEYWDFVRKWRPQVVALLARYRMSPFGLESLEMRWDEEHQKVQITNAEDFITSVRRYLALGCNMYSMGVPCFFNRSSFLGAKKGTPEYLQRITAAYKAAADFLRANNLPTHWLVYYADEVVVHKHSHPIDFDLLNAAYDAMHAADPHIKIYATEVPSPLIHTQCPIAWCMNVSSFDEDILREQKAKGCEVWWYNGYRLPRPAAHLSAPGMSHRATFWIMHKYDIDGYFIWTVNRWVGDPHKQPNRDKRSQAGTHYWLYPNPDGTVSPSLRLTMFRDGAEDYEYLAALDRLARRLDKQGKKKAAARCRAALERAQSLILAMDNTLAINYDDLRRARELVARTIEDESS